MDKRCEVDMAMYTESMVQAYQKLKICGPHGLVHEAPSFTFKTFIIAFGGLDGGTGLATWVRQLFIRNGLHRHVLIFLKLFV